LELKHGVSWLAVTPTVLRYVEAVGHEYAARDKKDFVALRFSLGTEHPVYEVLSGLLTDPRPPFAWHIRVPDLPAFLRHIAPALEQRLAGSVAVGHSGELKISFYRNGLRLVLEGGALVAVEPWMPTPVDSGAAWFPDHAFLQVLFGYRGLDELTHAFADCWIGTNQARVLLQVLFPKQSSDVWPVA
jgi:hypothetical protein